MKKNKFEKVLKFYAIVFVILFVIALGAGITAGFEILYSIYLYKENAHKKGYYFYSKNDKWLLKAGYVSNYKDTLLLFSDTQTKYLPYLHKYWVVDSLNNGKIVEFIGVNKDCWGFVKGYSLSKYLNQEPPPQALLNYKAHILDSLNTIDQNLSKRLNEKTIKPLGSVFGFYCPCED